MPSAKRQVFMALGRAYASTMKTAEQSDIRPGVRVAWEEAEQAQRRVLQASDPGPSWNVYRRLNAGKSTKTHTPPSKSRKNRSRRGSGGRGGRH